MILNFCTYVAEFFLNYSLYVSSDSDFDYKTLWVMNVLSKQIISQVQDIQVNKSD